MYFLLYIESLLPSCMKFPETRGRKPKKTYNLKPGELKKLQLSERQAIYYAAKVKGWKIKTAEVDGKLLCFREK